MQDKKFIRKFEKKVKDTINKYKLLKRGERIIVAASGGKDSITILYLLQKFGFKAEALHINLHLGKYSEKCLENVREFCKRGEIRLHVVDMKKEFGSSMCYIREEIQSRNKITNCMACGVIKKWVLNRYARKLKADKIVTGHNLDDEAQTVLINIMRGNPALSINLGPKTGVLEDRKFVSRVKPLYFSAENDIRKYSELINLPVSYEKCPCAIGSYRVETRKFLNGLENAGFKVKKNIISNFLEILPRLQNYFLDKTEKLVYCKVCGEPSRNNVCKACQLLER
ncbi:TIGR00269 family protein [Candidatus Pacearchaeota archaeon]|nr:TIGR00269 family protein [Candidatus Pacearchaeota archaeon]